MIVELDHSPAPAETLSRLAHLPRPCLLEGSADHHDLGRYSFFAADPVATITASAAEWPVVRDRIRRTITPAFPRDPALPPFQGGWMGWFSYELGSAFDRFPRAAADDLHVPDVALALYDWVIGWDHRAGRAWLISTGVVEGEARSGTRAQKRAEGVLGALSGGPRQPRR